LEKIALIVAGKEAISSIDEYLSLKSLRLKKAKNCSRKKRENWEYMRNR